MSFSNQEQQVRESSSCWAELRLSRVITPKCKTLFALACHDCRVGFSCTTSSTRTSQRSHAPRFWHHREHSGTGGESPDGDIAAFLLKLELHTWF